MRIASCSAATSIVLLTLAATAACSKGGDRTLRGTHTLSPDGRTLFVLDEERTCPLLLDGKPWSGTVGVPVPLLPGPHTIDCAGTTPPMTIELRAGHTFHLDYWGP